MEAQQQDAIQWICKAGLRSVLTSLDPTVTINQTWQKPQEDGLLWLETEENVNGLLLFSCWTNAVLLFIYFDASTVGLLLLCWILLFSDSFTLLQLLSLLKHQVILETSCRHTHRVRGCLNIYTQYTKYVVVTLNPTGILKQTPK